MSEIDEQSLKRVLAERIKFYRTRNQELTAEEANISKDTISKLEREMTIPNTLTLLKVCNALKITPNELLDGFFKDNKKENDIDKSKKLLEEIRTIIKKYNIQ